MRCLFDPWIQDPGWLKVWIRDEQPGSYFRELRNINILKFFDADPGSGIEKMRIRDGKNSERGSGINIPDPQHFSHDRQF
jgi:hypothetical protein